MMFVTVVAAKFLVLVLEKLMLMVAVLAPMLSKLNFIRSIPVTPTAHALI